MIGPVPALTELARLRAQLDAFGVVLTALSLKSLAARAFASFASRLEGRSFPDTHTTEVCS